MNKRQLDFFHHDEMGKETSVAMPVGEKPSLFLIDGMAMVYRAFFALQRAGMTSPDGIPTGAVYGFATALLKIFETYKPNYLAAVFDSKEKTFRHDLIPNTKLIVQRHQKILSYSSMRCSNCLMSSTSR